MSAFGRAFLRLAACAALRGQTLVVDEVYDSRIAALDPETWAPNISDIAGSIGVYTEQDSGPALAEQNGGPPFRPTVELVLEIAMQARVKTEDGYVVGSPETDDDLEMTLDFIEGQAELALFRRQHAAAVAFRKLTKQTQDKTSIRFTDPKSSAKLAIRYVTYKVEVADPELMIFDAALSGLDRLPEPWRSVALSWPSDYPERDKAEKIAAALVPQAQPAFAGADSSVHVSAADPFNASWEIPQT